MIGNFFSKEALQKIQTINVSVFPVFVLFFLAFALTEEIKPGFVIFYVSQWLIIIPVILSGILFATTEQEKDTSPLPKIWIRTVAIVFFQILFSIGFFWKVEIVPILLFAGIFIVSFVLFLLFQVALLFTDAEIEKGTQRAKTYLKKNIAKAFSILLLLVICLLFFLFWQWVKNPYFWKLEDTIPLEKTWEKVIEIPEEEEI